VPEPDEERRGDQDPRGDGDPDHEAREGLTATEELDLSQAAVLAGLLRDTRRRS
jgi:hypothetical protein